MKRTLCLFNIMLFMATSLNAESSWKRIGLEDIGVTSLSRSSNPLYPGLLIGTAGHGVYMLDGNGISPVRSIMTGGEDLDSMTITSLLAVDLYVGYNFLAGTEEGLYSYQYFAYMSSLPRWVKIEGISGVPKGVGDIISTRDSVLFAAVGDDIYRSIKQGSAWDTLTVFRGPLFRCLLEDPEDSHTLYAGSVFNGSRTCWMGVVESADQGDTWEIMGNIFNNDFVGVNTLEAYKTFSSSPYAYLAGTSNNIYYREETDTAWALWNTSGLDSKNIQDIVATYHDPSPVAHLYLAADDGVYSFDYRTNQIEWANIGIKPGLKVNVLGPNRLMECDSLYAGAGDGLYLYAEHGTTGAASPMPVPEGFLPEITVSPNPFSINTVISVSGLHKATHYAIYDFSNKPAGIFSQNESGAVIVDLKNCPEGVYILRVEINGRNYNRKLMKIL